MRSRSALLAMFVVSACAPEATDIAFDCEPTSNGGLAAAARADDACAKIVVAGTDLTNLAGLEEPAFGKHIVVSDNDALVDSSQIRRAHKVTFGCNDALATIEAETSEATLACARVPPAELRFLGVEYGNLGVTAAATAGIRLACADDSCAMSVGLDVDDLATTTFALDGEFHIDLALFTPLGDFAPLTGLGLPDGVYLMGEQDLTSMRAYLAWLTARGYSGPFKHCADDCVDVPLD